METKIAILIMIVLHFMGCTKPIKPTNHWNSIFLAKKELCLTCHVDLKK